MILHIFQSFRASLAALLAGIKPGPIPLILLTMGAASLSAFSTTSRCQAEYKGGKGHAGPKVPENAVAIFGSTAYKPRDNWREAEFWAEENVIATWSGIGCTTVNVTTGEVDSKVASIFALQRDPKGHRRGNALIMTGEKSIGIFDRRTGKVRLTIPSEKIQKDTVFLSLRSDVSQDGSLIVMGHQGGSDEGEAGKVWLIRSADGSVTELKIDAHAYTWGKLSNDGTLLITGGVVRPTKAERRERDKGRVQVWDVKKKQPLQTIRGVANVLAWAPDGLRLLGSDPDGKLTIWNVRTGDIVVQLSNNEPPHDLFVSWGKRLFIGDLWTARVIEWDEKTGERVQTLKPPRMPLCYGVLHLAGLRERRDGSIVALGWWGGMVKAWDAESGKLLTESNEGWDWVRWVHLSNDGKWCYTAGSDLTVSRWSVETGKLDRRLMEVPPDDPRRPRRSYVCHSRAISPNQDVLVATHWSEKDRLTVFDIPGEKELHDLEFGKWAVASPYSPVFSPDGKLFACGAHFKDGRHEQGLPIFRTSDWKLVQVVKIPLSDGAVCSFSPDSKQLLVLYAYRNDRDRGQGAVGLANWSLERQHLTDFGRIGFRFSLLGLTVSEKAAAVTGVGDRNGDRGYLQLHDRETGKKIDEIQGDWWRIETPPVFSGDGSRLAFYAAVRDGKSSIRVHDGVTLEPVAEFPPRGFGVLSLAFDREGKNLVAGNTDTTTIIWRVPAAPRGK